MLGAIKFPNQAQFNPVKYMIGLSSSIEKYGAKIYEDTKNYNKVSELEEFILCQ